MTQETWDRRFIALAEHISGWSKDPSTRVGAVIADQENRVISVGFNGFARNIHDTHERLTDRNVKLRMTIHAEQNAILFAQRPLKGCSIYIWPFMPCAVCAAMIVQSGISSVIAPPTMSDRWAADFALAREMFSEAHIEFRHLS